MNYLVKVVRNGQPVVGATVTVGAIGIDDTDENGVAMIPIPDGWEVCTRGARYAARIGKDAGQVADESLPLAVQIIHPHGAIGTSLKMLPDVEKTFDVSGI